MAVIYNNPRFLWSLFLSLCYFSAKSESTSDVYIVYLGHNHINDENLTSESHLNLLHNVFSSEEDAKRSVLYSYRYSFSGFAAKLDATQVNTLAEMEGVVSVFRCRILEVHTSRSWDFMGLTLNNNGGTSSPMQLAYGDDVIVGVFDTGIWPESESFRESPGMGAIPSSWKGACDQGESTIPPITCNRKLIGARYYYTGYEQMVQPIDPSFEYKSPRDKIGHGTHTASTAVGAMVHNASFYGIGKGTARGGAPRARLAVYKTCWNLTNSGSCCEADILAAFDQALKDGVHIISASFGAPPPLGAFFDSSVDIGSFHAMQVGVTVVFAGGNDDSLNPSMVQNVNPWSISVAASSFDRTYPTEMAISATEENFTMVGESLLTTEINGFLVDASTHFIDGICDRKLNIDYSKKANRRVVLCFASTGPTSIETAIDAVQNASGKGMIFVEALGRQIPEVEVVPTVRVDLQQGTRLRQFVGTTFNRPRIRITPNKGVIGRSPAPEVAYFSSRGPSSLSPDILKPDITAPGVNVLAAWPSNLSPSLSDSDDRRTHWNLQSGTSMACPHVSGVVALLKSVHPTWSPAAIKSALITTAYNKDTASDTIQSGGTTKTSDPFDIGAGHINPIKAMDPGLVYDMNTTDYIIFLCNMGYSPKHIRLIALNGTTTTCPQPSISTSNLNHPAITVSNLQSTTRLKRTVRNVGQNRNVIYFPRIVTPEGVDVYVWPRVLVFSWMKSEVSYYVTLSPRKRSQGRYDFGEIVWSDGFHSVRSPIIVCVNNTAGFGAMALKLSSYYGRIGNNPL